MDPLRTAVVMDYQNVHLSAADLFAPDEPRQDSLVHPFHFARRLVNTRNRMQRDGYPQAELVSVHVFRGLPDATHEPQQHRYCTENGREWEASDDRVHVTLRPLKYRYERDEWGAKCLDENGVAITKGRPTEKGVDVLCALSVVQLAASPGIDLVILASRDTDLQPALDAVLVSRTARVETTSWKLSSDKFGGRLRPSQPHSAWNTFLDENDFQASRDRTDYDAR